jgi:glycine oxidase
MSNPGMNTPDILVIGGGIIGCSLARELARAQRTVIVVERGQIGCAASSAAAGLLAPTLAAAPPPPLAELCYQSAALYESWVDELRAEGAGDVGFRRPGILAVGADAVESAHLQQCVADYRRPGRPAEWLSGRDVRRKEPAIESAVVGAIYYPDDAQVNPARLVRQVARVAELAGVQIRENEPVLKLIRAGDRIIDVQTVSTLYHPGLVVLTSGAWTGDLATAVGLNVPTRPVKGQLLQVECRTSPVHAPLHIGETLFVPRPDGRLVIGVTVEEAGYDDRVTLDGLRTILQGACAVVPAVGRLPLGRAWAGLRPATPDELPCMGPAAPLRNLWVSAGHFRKGILLAPLCARLMARSILADQPDVGLGAFTPNRCSSRQAP